jgi:phosphoribosylamine--glycine ligase / phosphoribosylformylglycinamidine cyclo-ligase
VLVIGSGGREHAIAVKLAESKFVSKVFVAPGNGGTAMSGGKVENVIHVLSHSDILKFAIENSIFLVVIGPEQPLVDGLVDECKKLGITCFGPSAAAAKLEASKAWSKDFMKRNGIKTADFGNFTSFDSAKQYIERFGRRVVIKASGLAAGKGVLMPTTTQEAVEAAKQIMVDKIFGDAGKEVVVEEFLEGEEVSVLAFCDGHTCAVMPGAQDHKRIYDGDLGPNTGGNHSCGNDVDASYEG